MISISFSKNFVKGYNGTIIYAISTNSYLSKNMKTVQAKCSFLCIKLISVSSWYRLLLVSLLPRSLWKLQILPKTVSNFKYHSLNKFVLILSGLMTFLYQKNTLKKYSVVLNLYIKIYKKKITQQGQKCVVKCSTIWKLCHPVCSTMDENFRYYTQHSTLLQIWRVHLLQFQTYKSNQSYKSYHHKQTYHVLYVGLFIVLTDVHSNVLCKLKKIDASSLLYIGLFILLNDLHLNIGWVLQFR